MYWWFVYFIFWKSVLGVTARTSLLVLVEFDDSSLSPCLQEPEFWAFSCWEHSTCGLGVVRSSFLVSDYLVLHRHSPDWPDIPNPAEDFPSHSTGCVTPRWWVSPLLESLASVSPSVNLHWKSLLDPSLTWLSAFRSDQQENCWNGCKRTSRNSWYWKSEEGGSTRHAWNSLWLPCQQVGFCCQQIWLGSLVPIWFCRTTNQAQHCGFWKRVSLLDFVLW